MGKFEYFRPLWIELYVNQAIYLLQVSDEGTKAHEHNNLHRIMDLLVGNHNLVSQDSKKLLARTLKEKSDGAIKGGLTLTDELKEKINTWSKTFK